MSSSSSAQSTELAVPNLFDKLATDPDQDASQFVELIHQLGIENAIGNIDTQLHLWQPDDTAIPVTVNQTEYNNSYVCSPYTAYISYARDELGLLNNALLETGLKGAIGLAGGALRLAKINQTVSINNWLVSTNLVPSWSNDTLHRMTSDLTTAYPNHSLSIRSLNTTHHADVMQRLTKQGWLLVPARQVYLFDNESRTWWKRNHTKKDQKLLQKTELTYVPPSDIQPQDFAEMEACFHQLFIEKHSHYNPQFQAAFFQGLHQAGLVDFHGFRDGSGRLVAVIGLFTQQDIITTPIVGYDTRLPRELGLYRLLMAVLLRETYDSGLAMNLSSGAGGFKRMRGGEPTLEYTAFYVKHLPRKQRWAMAQFAKLLNRYAPAMFEKHEI